MITLHVRRYNTTSNLRVFRDGRLETGTPRGRRFVLNTPIAITKRGDYFERIVFLTADYRTIRHAPLPRKLFATRKT